MKTQENNQIKLDTNPSRFKYMKRRAGALLLSGGLVAGAGLGVNSIIGSNKTPEASAASSTLNNDQTGQLNQTGSFLSTKQIDELPHRTAVASNEYPSISAITDAVTGQYGGPVYKELQEQAIENNNPNPDSIAQGEKFEIPDYQIKDPSSSVLQK